MKVDYRKLREPAVVFTVLCFVLLMLVGTFFLDKSHATHRWFSLGPASLQPSELAKLAVILYLAWFLDCGVATPPPANFGMNDLRHTLLPAVGSDSDLRGLDRPAA